MNMLTSSYWIILSVIATLVATIGFIMLLPIKSTKDEDDDYDDIHIDTNDSIVTIRKISKNTSVTIKNIPHHIGDVGENLEPSPIEVTRKECPKLFAEYMSKSTSAIRKYEIMNFICFLGLTLPYIEGLNEKYKKEIAEKQAESQTQNPQKEAPPSSNNDIVNSATLFEQEQTE